jgi:hypothetical protein
LALTYFYAPQLGQSHFFGQRHDRQHLPTGKRPTISTAEMDYIRKEIRLFFMTPCRTAEVSKATGADPNLSAR